MESIDAKMANRYVDTDAATSLDHFSMQPKNEHFEILLNLRTHQPLYTDCTEIFIVQLLLLLFIIVFGRKMMLITEETGCYNKEANARGEEKCRSFVKMGC